MSSAQPYRVLARKYRPQTFEDLIGQEALVQTLRNGIQSGRIAQAYMLTGVRGVGKTTTARILARALNCIGADGSATVPVLQPCGVCEHCVAIAEDRHIDVLETDAASRTGVDDMRDLLESVAYRPAMARTKVYIIDEVHMLSKSAFNALLKTLEEPPAHVVFVFATTDLHKVPVTILSRCQRFDLRRVTEKMLAAHLQAIASREQAILSDEAAMLLGKAAGGSVRDSLSLLDQAIALSAGVAIDAPLIQGMLGLVARSDLQVLFSSLIDGDAASMLEQVTVLYEKGAEPEAILADVQGLIHQICRVQAASAGENDDFVRQTAEKLPIAKAMMLWQMALQGMAEVKKSDAPLQALEMVLIRLCYARELPDPGSLMKYLKGDAGAVTVPSLSSSSVVPQRPAMAATPVALASYEELVELCTARRQPRLSYLLRHQIRCVKFQNGAMEIILPADVPGTLPNDLAAQLLEWTGERWVISLATVVENAPLTLAEKAEQQQQEQQQRLQTHPLVAAALKAFPGARIVS